MVCRNCRQEFGSGPFCRQCGAPRATAIARRGRGWAFGLLGLVVALVAGLVIWRVAAPPTTGGTAIAGAPGSGVRPVPPTTSGGAADPTSGERTDPTASGETGPVTGEEPGPGTDEAPGPTTSEESGPTTDQGPGGAGTPTGELTVALGSLPSSTDPAEEAGHSVVWGQVFDTLTTYRGTDIAAAGDLAEDWSSSADATEWTFSIVADRTFHDGSAVTAEAVCQNFRYWDEQSQQEDPRYYDYLFYLGNDRFESCEADGDQAVLTFTEPMAAMPDIVSLSSFSIHAPDSLGTTDVVGSGPFTWVGAQRGESIELAAAEGGGAGVATVTFRAISDQAAMKMSVAAGDVQLAFTRSLVPDEGSAVTTEPAPADDLWSLTLFGGQKALTDEAVRAAVVQAMDREALVAEAGASPAPAVLPGAFGADRAEFLQFDPETAKKALSGKKITLRLAVPEYGNSAEQQRMIAGLTQQLKTVGVTVKPVKLASVGDYYDALQSGEVDLAFTRWVFWMADVGDYIGSFRQPGAFGKLVGDKQAEALNMAIDTALKTPDYQQRQAASTAVLAGLLESNTVIPLFSTGGKWLVAEGVSGFETPVFEMPALETVTVG